MTHRGHTVLQVPVPPLEDFVRGRHAHYDPGFVSADPAFGHAHVTALGPFLPEPGPEALARVGAIAAATAPFDFVLQGLATFPTGIIHLVPAPDRAFRELTARLVARFPECPPYSGMYDEVVPHLTLDLTAPGIDEASTRDALGATLPARCRAERLDLAWWADGDCRLLRSWPLGGAVLQ